MRLKSTLDQWGTLRAISEAGSIQSAAKLLNKSHTTLIYSIKKLEQQMDLKLVEVKGRKAVLTEQGYSLLRRANSVLEQVKELEELSQQLASGLEAEIVVAVDHLCNPTFVYQPLASYLETNSATSVRVIETSLTKTSEMVMNQEADIAIITLPITDYPAEAFSLTKMLPVAANNHPLANEPELRLADLSRYCQVVIRDLGAPKSTKASKTNVGWLKASQRVTVDNFDHALRAIEQGVGFGRLPQHIVEQKNRGQLTILDVEESGAYQVPLHITLPKGSKTGPAARQLYQWLINHSQSIEK